MPKLNLQKRERLMVAVGVVAVIAILLYLFVPSYLEKYDQARARLETARQNLTEAKDMRNQVLALRSGEQAVREMAARRASSFDLMAVISTKLRQTDLIERAEMQSGRGLIPGATSVTVNLNGVTLEELVDLLYLIYSSDSLVVLYNMRTLRPAQDGLGLDCTVTFVSPVA